MPQTYNYKVRTGRGACPTELVGDSGRWPPAPARDGLTPVEVKQAGTGLKMEINLRPGRVKLKTIAVFCRQFATMVNSGLPILRAISILADQTDNRELEKVLVQARTDVEQGSSLSAALAKHPKRSPPVNSMIEAGETGGVLDDVPCLSRIRSRRMFELRRSDQSSMTDPVVVVALVVDSARCPGRVPRSRRSTRTWSTLPYRPGSAHGSYPSVLWYMFLLATGVGTFLARR